MLGEDKRTVSLFATQYITPSAILDHITSITEHLLFLFGINFHHDVLFFPLISTIIHQKSKILFHHISFIMLRYKYNYIRILFKVFTFLFYVFEFSIVMGKYAPLRFPSLVVLGVPHLLVSKDIFTPMFTGDNTDRCCPFLLLSKKSSLVFSHFYYFLSSLLFFLSSLLFFFSVKSRARMSLRLPRFSTAICARFADGRVYIYPHKS